MVYENEYVGPTMPYYQFYPQQMQVPGYYNDIYNDRSFYYQQSNMHGAHMPQMNNGYIQPYMGGGYMPNPYYMNEAVYGPGPESTNYFPESNESEQGMAANRVMQQFLDENGQMDFQKMLSTVGQFADTVQQVSPVIKQLNDLVRSFRA